MDRTLLSVILLASLLASCTTEPPSIENFEQEVMVGPIANPFGLLANADGITVFINVIDNGHQAVVCLKTRYDGSVMWLDTVADLAGFKGHYAKRLRNGAVVICGEKNGDGAVAWLNNSGQFVYQVRTFGGALTDWLTNITELPEGNFMAVGNTQSSGAGADDLWLLHLNGSGDLVWEKTFGGPGRDGGSDVLVSPSGALMVHGFTENFGASGRDLWLIEVNGNGDSLWSMRFGGADYEESHAMRALPNGNLIFSSHTASTDPTHQLLALCSGPDGSTIWQREFGTTTAHDGGEHLLISSKDHLYFVGRTNSFGPDEDIFLAITDLNGNTIDQQRFGGAGQQQGRGIIEANGAIYILGQTENEAQQGVYIIRQNLH